MARKTFEAGTVMSTPALLSFFGDKQTKVTIHKEQYGNNGALALTITDAETGEPCGTLSVNIMSTEHSPCSLPSSKLPLNMCFVKIWSENEGLLEQLIEQKVVKLNGPQHQDTGAPIVQVLF
jgi:hypothetical protein